MTKATRPTPSVSIPGAARTALEHDDIGTRRLFEEIVMDEEGHYSWLELQLSLLERMGEPAFIAKNMSGPTEDE